MNETTENEIDQATVGAVETPAPLELSIMEKRKKVVESYVLDFVEDLTYPLKRMKELFSNPYFDVKKTIITFKINMEIEKGSNKNKRTSLGGTYVIETIKDIENFIAHAKEIIEKQENFIKGAIGFKMDLNI